MAGRAIAVAALGERCHRSLARRLVAEPATTKRSTIAWADCSTVLISLGLPINTAASTPNENQPPPDLKYFNQVKK